MAIQTALVVDDSRSARYILQRVLERQHIHVDGVGSAHEALSYLSEYRPDVVFMDDMMPGMEGQEAIDRLASNPATASIPIIMYTGRYFGADAPLPQRCGVVGVLNKPFAPQDVDALLAKLCGTVAPPSVTARLTREPAATSKPSVVSASSTKHVEQPTAQMPAELSQCVAEAVAAEMAAERAWLTREIKAATQLAVEQTIGELLENEVRTQIEEHEIHWRHSLESVRQAQSRFQEQLLEQRIPRLLDILGQRLQGRMDAVQKSMNEHIENGSLGPLQRTQVAHIASTTATEAAQRPARQAARHAAAELMRTDFNALNVQVERLRRRYSNVATSAVIAVLAAAVMGYWVGVLG